MLVIAIVSDPLTLVQWRHIPSDLKVIDLKIIMNNNTSQNPNPEGQTTLGGVVSFIYSSPVLFGSKGYLFSQLL